MSSPRMLIHSVIQYQILIDYTQRKCSTKTHKYMHFYSRYLNKNICDSIELFKIYVNELFLLWLCWICHGCSVPVRRNNPWIDFLIIDCWLYTWSLCNVMMINIHMYIYTLQYWPERKLANKQLIFFLHH